jgi:hypothetical protein
MKKETTYALEIYEMTYRGDRRKKYDPKQEYWHWSLHHEFDTWDQAMDCIAHPDWAPDKQFRIIETTRHTMTTGCVGDYNLNNKCVIVHLKDDYNEQVVVSKTATYEEIIEVINQKIGADNWDQFKEIKT